MPGGQFGTAQIQNKGSETAGEEGIQKEVPANKMEEKKREICLKNADNIADKLA